jgi:hypothetical protein
MLNVYFGRTSEDHMGSINLKDIASSHSAEIDGILDGISGRSSLWTSAMRPTARKDDPPEDEQE